MKVAERKNVNNFNSYKYSNKLTSEYLMFHLTVFLINGLINLEYTRNFAKSSFRIALYSLYIQSI